MTTLSPDSGFTEQLQLRLSDSVTAFVAFRGDATREAVSKLIRLLAVQFDLDAPKTDATPTHETTPLPLCTVPADGQDAQR